MKNELKVIAKAKELSKVVFEITESSPKKFRFTLVTRMQNISLEIISELYAANDTYVNAKILDDMDKSIAHAKNQKDFSSEEERMHYQNKLFELKLTKALTTEEKIKERVNHSYLALTKIKELDWLTNLSADMQCITLKQQERLAGLIYETRALIGGFIKSDKQRFGY